MTKRAATVAFVVFLLALTGCGSVQPVSSPPSALSDAPPNEVSGLDIPPGRIDDAISKLDGDTFTFPLTNENAPPGTISKVTFSSNTLNLEYFDSGKLGTFTR
jgi:predicted small lipoprotein YifL